MQLPGPAPAVDTPMLPEVPLPEPEAGAEQLTDADVAPLVVQLNVFAAPAVTVALVNDALVTLGALTTLRLAEPDVPATPRELYGVTVQLPVPVPDVPTVPPEFTALPE